MIAANKFLGYECNFCINKPNLCDDSAIKNKGGVSIFGKCSKKI